MLMAKMIFAVLGGALVLIGSFVLSLKAIDYFGLLPSGPIVSLLAGGKDSLVTAGEPYDLTYKSSGAKSCEMIYRSAADGSSGRFPVTSNTTGATSSGLIGVYTLTCVGFDGRTASKSVTISRSPK
jgi:hypothetical protein